MVHSTLYSVLPLQPLKTLARDIVIEEVEELPIYTPDYKLEQPIKASSIRREAEDSSKVVISGSTMIEILKIVVTTILLQIIKCRLTFQKVQMSRFCLSVAVQELI